MSVWPGVMQSLVVGSGLRQSELEAVDRLLADLTARYDVAAAERDELGDQLARAVRERDDVTRERDTLQARVAELERAFAPAVEPKPPRRIISLANVAFALLAVLVVAAAAAALAVATGLWKLETPNSDATTVGVAPETGATVPAITSPTTTAGSSVSTAPDLAEPEGATVEAAPLGPLVREPAPAVRPAIATVALTATRGKPWVQVRNGGARGEVLYDGFIPAGVSKTFSGERVWMRLGDPSTLRLNVNGEPAENVPSGTANVLVTAEGLKTLSVG